MSRAAFDTQLEATLDRIRADGLWKHEREIVSPQGSRVELADGPMLNFCANNYLGLADDPRVIAAAIEAMESHGFGMASVRFICGTLDLHRALEETVADFLGTDDAISFAACFDANGGVFEPLLGEDDAIVSDSLNHASIIDGIRLCKARRYRFETRDLDDLDRQLTAARADGAEHVVVVSDGVFSMDGFLAGVDGLCEVADRHGALVMVDDAHATGVVGPEGRGTPALHGLADRVDIVTSTLGKALGGGMGGFVAARQPIVDLLRQRARPYLFSNALAPGLLGGAIEAIGIARAGDDLRARLFENAARFRTALGDAGFTLTGEGHPIIPVMIGDATVAGEFARRLGERGIYVTAFSYPVVPMGTARIRTQMSAAHTPADLDARIAAFVEVGRELGLVGAS
ncbi:MAG: glycine C-acetyltransferase, partial [Actinobacteria bacterium]|nr:glycine C-acetyltransferase [Actinomycetota bacterium]NIS33026.1 glycine C-acetyltransferase [Actinomycetota bacterium]NIT94383.1 glycine C-acetyltransferase [Actinomycetota bacterium]NIU17987.1 glycine C-acetyltransferase [Actinomycetota bacterium]NIU64573.1 glycine C-acetyltransferase [Actinomycetota bacterium]